MFKKINFLLFTVFILLSSIKLEAVEVKDLYQASVAINSQSNKDRAIALKKALAAVMLKVGGEQSILKNEVIKRSLSNYDSYLSQYRYQYKTLNIADKEGNTKQLFLFASFNEARINELFQQANLPLWGNLRPQVLLWLIDENGLNRNIISNSSSSNLPFIVNEFSLQRGLPIIMPLMDLVDTEQIKVSDVWGRFTQPIQAASSRYSAEAIVVVRISNASLVTGNSNVMQTDSELNERNNYVLDWDLLGWNSIAGQQLLGQKQPNQRYQGANPQELLQQGLSDITELIYQRYALSTTQQHDFAIDVTNVNTLADYVEVSNFLNKLSAVKSATLISATGNSRRFNLKLLGSKEALFASLKLNKKLTRTIVPLAYFTETLSPEEAVEPLVPVFNWSK